MIFQSLMLKNYTVFVLAADLAGSIESVLTISLGILASHRLSPFPTCLRIADTPRR